jgi:hypothetical protein
MCGNVIRAIISICGGHLKKSQDSPIFETELPGKNTENKDSSMVNFS